MKDRNFFLKELDKGLKISKKFEGGYSTLGDRSEYIIKLYKSLKTSDEIFVFKEAIKEFLLSGDNEKIDFIVDVLTDSIDFGNVL
jgi:hypothetical protein